MRSGDGDRVEVREDRTVVSVHSKYKIELLKIRGMNLRLSQRASSKLDTRLSYLSRGVLVVDNAMVFEGGHGP